MIEFDGRFWLNINGKPFLGEGRVELLKKIDELGSIHSASKAMKMSYKAAWDMLKQMSELSQESLFDKQIGGKGGGGTKLTPYAKEMIVTFEKFNKLFKEFMDKFKEAGDNPVKLQAILNRTFLTTSARNQFLCQVIDIKNDGLTSIVTLLYRKDIELKSKITTKSLKNMSFCIDDNIYAIIKSSDIKIAISKPSKTDELNIFYGEIVTLDSSSSKTEVCLKIKEGFVLVAIIKSSLFSDLKVGMKLYAIINSENILIGI